MLHFREYFSNSFEVKAKQLCVLHALSCLSFIVVQIHDAHKVFPLSSLFFLSISIISFVFLSFICMVGSVITGQSFVVLRLCLI